MQNSSQTTVKTPWVPPPARTTKGSNISPKISGSGLRIEEVSHTEVNEFGHLEISSDTELESVASKVSSAMSSSAINMTVHFPGNPKGRQEAIEKSKVFLRELKMLKTHRELLKLSAELLIRPIKMKCMSGDQMAANTMITQAGIQVQALLDTFEEVSTHINNFEADSSRNLEEYVSIFTEFQDRLKTELLTGYECVMTALKFLFEVHIHGHLPSLHNEHLNLRQSVESVTERLDSMQSELEASKQHVRSLLSEKASMENVIQQLQNQLEQSEVVRRKVMEESRTNLMKNTIENEKLYDTMELLQKQHNAEKEALKKAIKFQKMRADQQETELVNLKNNFNEKERHLYSIAADRDQWKIQLTSLSNKLIDKENLVQDLLEKNSVMQDKMDECESTYQLELGKMKTESRHNATLLEKCQREKEDVKDSTSTLKKKLEATKSELESLQQQHEELKETFKLQCHASCRGMEDEARAFIALLQEMQKTFSHESRDNRNLEHPDMNNSTLHGLINEVKDHLSEVRDLYRVQSARNSALDNRVPVSAKQSEFGGFDLMKKCESLEAELHRLRHPSLTSQSHNDALIHYKDYGRLEGHWSREGDFDPKSGSNRAQSDEKSRQEEQLLVKDREIATLEQKISEVERKHSDEMKEMKSKLVHVTSNHESLQKYVKILKSSYTNVFGGIT